MDATTQSFPAPIFVGGSARSGTHAMGRLLDAHPRYHMTRVEARFHCATGGLTDLIAGRTDLDSYCERVLGMWWQRGMQQHRGLMVVIGREEIERAVERFRDEFPGDPLGAGRRLVHAVLDPGAERAGKPAWVDLSGSNIKNAPGLLELFPRARFINMVRDGRAVTAAILQKRDMTDDREQAFNHWEMRVRRSHEALRLMPPGTVLTIFLDDLTAHDRDATFTRLTEHLRMDDAGPMRDYFDTTISPQRAHVGAWRQRMAPADVRWVERRYRRLVKRLRSDGIDWVPEPGG